ncbi:MAG TPA: patatin-like phospholipase family protein [Thermoanaerobaculia bacterium]
MSVPAGARFDRIALSLSGGGYRAAAFHLGVLSFLHEVNIIENVRALSTASGGTIVGAFYAQCLAEGLAFGEFFSRMYAFLRDVDVIDAALARMPDHGKLIVAAADVYADLFTVTLGKIRSSRDHLEEISFNATDMRNGLAFRFVKTANRHVRSGNREMPLDDDLAASLRLADVVAASACFPGAFEPILFPADFGVPFDRHVALMDGGIYDNQGIDSLLLVRSRREEIDRIIISDADVSAPPMYEEPAKRWLGIVPVWGVALAAGVLETAAIASAMTSRQILPTVVSATTAVLVGLLIFAAVRLKQSPIANRPRPLLWRHILRLTLSELVAALETRASSLIALTSRVFMKRVRMLTYRRVFETPSTSGRAIGNLIVDLMRDSEASDEMQRIGLLAASMPTTLWFDDEQHLREVIAAGRMTTCRSLLRHIERIRGKLPVETAQLRERCEKAWQSFHENPLR